MTGFQGRALVDLMKPVVYLSILTLSFVLAAPGYCQSKEVVEQISKITKRQQTSASALLFACGLAEAKGDYKGAAESYSQLLQIYKDDPGVGSKSARFAWILSKLALCQSKLNEKDEATKTCTDAMSVINGKFSVRTAEDGELIEVARRNCSRILGK